MDTKGLLGNDILYPLFLLFPVCSDTHPLPTRVAIKATVMLANRGRVPRRMNQRAPMAN